MKGLEPKYKYIAIEGNIGAGKTALADKLAAEYGATIIHEQFEDNALLAPFYQNPEKYAFQLEMSFLKSRFQQLSDENVFSNLLVISDYYFGKSLVFAKTNLTDIQFEEFKNTYQLLYQKLHSPDLIIYLRNGVVNLQKNIRKRGRSYEQQISDNYLDKITKGYDAFFAEIIDIPILWIDISDSDFISNIQKIEESLKAELSNGISKMEL